MNTSQVALPAFFAELVVLAPLAAAIVALAALIYNGRLQRLAKSIDVVADYHKRFEKLTYETVKEVKDRDSLLVYAKRFWELQNEQFLLWRNGFLPNPIFKYWLSLRHDGHSKALVTNVAGVPETSAKVLWDEVKGKLHSPAFEDLIADLEQKGYETAYTKANRRRIARSVLTVLGIVGVTALVVFAVIAAAFYLWPIVHGILSASPPPMPPLLQPGG